MLEKKVTDEGREKERAKQKKWFIMSILGGEIFFYSSIDPIDLVISEAIVFRIFVRRQQKNSFCFVLLSTLIEFRK